MFLLRQPVADDLAPTALSATGHRPAYLADAAGAPVHVASLRMHAQERLQACTTLAVAVMMAMALGRVRAGPPGRMRARSVPSLNTG